MRRFDALANERSPREQFVLTWLAAGPAFRGGGKRRGGSSLLVPRRASARLAVGLCLRAQREHSRRSLGAIRVLPPPVQSASGTSWSGSNGPTYRSRGRGHRVRGAEGARIRGPSAGRICVPRASPSARRSWSMRLPDTLFETGASPAGGGTSALRVCRGCALVVIGLKRRVVMDDRRSVGILSFLAPIVSAPFALHQRELRIVARPPLRSSLSTRSSLAWLEHFKATVGVSSRPSSGPRPV